MLGELLLVISEKQEANCYRSLIDLPNPPCAIAYQCKVDERQVCAQKVDCRRHFSLHIIVPTVVNLRLLWAKCMTN